MVAVVAVRQPPPSAQIHRLRVREYVMLADLLQWSGTELIEGIVYDMPAGSRLHADAVKAIYEALRPAFPDERVSGWGSVEAGEFSMPEPDVYVEPAGAARGDYPHARSLRLGVEVSVTTLDHDQGPKALVYASGGVPEFWVVVPAGAASYLLRHSQPGGGVYREIERIELPGGVEGIDVAAILRRSRPASS